MVVVNLDLVVQHSCILSYFQFMMVEIMSYPSSDKRPKTLVTVLRKYACAIVIFCTHLL